jgi:hypothetical protein
MFGFNDHYPTLSKDDLVALAGSVATSHANVGPHVEAVLPENSRGTILPHLASTNVLLFGF